MHALNDAATNPGPPKFYAVASKPDSNSMSTAFADVSATMPSSANIPGNRMRPDCGNFAVDKAWQEILGDPHTEKLSRLFFSENANADSGLDWKALIVDCSSVLFRHRFFDSLAGAVATLNSFGGNMPHDHDFPAIRKIEHTCAFRIGAIACLDRECSNNENCPKPERISHPGSAA